MTRETKIGLLVGLAFIVVFAVLLSHTGTVPPPGESPVTVIAQNTRRTRRSWTRCAGRNHPPRTASTPVAAPGTHPAEAVGPAPRLR